jgi:hypothetical protein
MLLLLRWSYGCKLVMDKMSFCRFGSSL